MNLVDVESSTARATRVFSQFDTEGSGFISADQLSDVMQEFDLDTDPE